MMNTVFVNLLILFLLTTQLVRAGTSCTFTKDGSYIYAHATKLRGIVSLAIGDFDGGGDYEIIAVGTGEVSGAGEGDRAIMTDNTGSLPHTLDSNNQDVIVDPFKVRKSDLDADGNLDVIVAADQISYYAGDGTNVTKNDDTTEVAVAATDAGRGNKEVLCVSINNGEDSRTDVVVADSNYDHLKWYEPNAGFSSFTANDIATSYNGAIGAAAIDLDGDGDYDIVASAQADNDISWFENDSSGGFTKNTIISSGYSPGYLRMADLDGDGDDDIVVIDHDNDKLSWIERDGATSFTGTITNIDTSAGEPVDIQVADIDGDGDIDIMITADDDVPLNGFDSDDSGDDSIIWYQNDGSANFTKNVITSSYDPREFRLFDYDGDGYLDIIVTDYGDDAVYLWTNSCTTTSDGQLFFAP